MAVSDTKTKTDLAPSERALLPNGDVIVKRLDQAAVLLHIPSNRIFELNETGVRVWELIGENLDPDHIARQLVDEFDVEYAVAVDEVKNLIARLWTEGLLEP